MKIESYNITDRQIQNVKMCIFYNINNIGRIFISLLNIETKTYIKTVIETCNMKNMAWTKSRDTIKQYTRNRNLFIKTFGV